MKITVLMIIPVLLFVTACSSLPSGQGKMPSGPSVKGEKIAAALKARGDYRGAAELYHKLLRKHPGRPDLWLTYSDILYKLADYKAAADAYETVLEFGNRTCEPLVGLGKSYLRLSRPSEALSHLTYCLKRSPNNKTALKLMAIVQDLSGSPAQSHAYYRQAIAADPADVALQNNYGLSLMLAGHYDQAITVLSKIAFGRSSTVRMRQNLALAYGLQGDELAAENLIALDFPDDVVKSNLRHYRLVRHLKDENGIRSLLAEGGERVSGY